MAFVFIAYEWSKKSDKNEPDDLNINNEKQNKRNRHYAKKTLFSNCKIAMFGGSSCRIHSVRLIGPKKVQNDEWGQL